MSHESLSLQLGPAPLETFLSKRLSSSSTQQEEYFAHLIFAITRFQLLELELKIYILLAHRRIAEGVKASFEYRYKEDDIFRMPLGSLVRAFRKHGGNPDLAKKIEGLTEKRNKVAHQGFIQVPDELRPSFPSLSFDKALEEMKEIAKAVQGVPAEVSKETMRMVPDRAFLRPIPRDTDDGATPTPSG